MKKLTSLIFACAAALFALGCGGNTEGTENPGDKDKDVYENPDYDFNNYEIAPDNEDKPVESSDEIPTETDTNGKTISWCNLQYPESAGSCSGELFYGRVFVDGCTNGDGKCNLVKAQAGLGDGFKNLSGVEWTWRDAAYNTDVDGMSAGDKANDEYSVKVGDESSQGSVAYRFSLDDGATWTYCDMSGIIQPDAPVKLAELKKETCSDGDYAEVEEETHVETDDAEPLEEISHKEVGWCNLQYVPDSQYCANMESGLIYGRAYVAGATDGNGQGAGVKAQVGLGKSVKPLDGADWKWTDAVYNVDVDAYATGDKKNDEYKGTVKALESGDYAVAYRFSVDNGATWTYCDYSGLIQPNGAVNLGALKALAYEVCNPPEEETADGDHDLDAEPDVADEDVAEIEEEAAPKVKVTCAVLEAPTDIETYAGDPIEHTAVACVTSCSSHPCAEVQAQAAIGSKAVDPWTWPGWTNAAYKELLPYAGPGGDHARYAIKLTAPAETGVYKLTFRFKTTDAAEWIYADSDGATGSSDFDYAKVTVVNVIPPKTVGWCNVQSPMYCEIASGGKCDIYGRVFKEGSTNVGTGMGEGIVGQAGYGPPDSDPASKSWTWLPAMFNVDAGNDDEYKYSFDAQTLGTYYDAAFRFSADGGANWKYCDLNGSDDGYSYPQSSVFVSYDDRVGWCNIQSPLSVTEAQAHEGADVYGRVFKDGVTQEPGDSGKISAQLCVGKPDVKPWGGSYQCFDAAFNAQYDNNDEYAVKLKLENAKAGDVYLFRFKPSNGQFWTYCNSAGPIDRFDSSAYGKIAQ